jgi:methylmalonyl-CoA/ethylmalonyl-CoA epimerase
MNASPAGSLITRLGQIAVTVHDLERATAFYRDALGLQLLFAVSGMAFFDCGGVRLMLALPEKPEFDHPSSILYFVVSDITDSHRRLSEFGVRFQSVPRMIAPMATYDLWMGFFLDSEDNVMALMSEVPRAK